MANYQLEINRILNEHWPEDQVLLVIGNPAIREVITFALLLEGGYTPVLASTPTSLFEMGDAPRSAILVLDLDLLEQRGYAPAAFLSRVRECWAGRSPKIVVLTSRRAVSLEVSTQARLLYQPFRLLELLSVMHAAATSLSALS